MPKRTDISTILIIGAGPIGLELAQAFRRLGSSVTVVEAATALPHDDPELAGGLASSSLTISSLRRART